MGLARRAEYVLKPCPVSYACNVEYIFGNLPNRKCYSRGKACFFVYTVCYAAYIHND